MIKKFMIFNAFAVLLSVTAYASAARYMYVVVEEGKTQKVYNINMDPIYDGGLLKSWTRALQCTYKTARGDIERLEFDGIVCGSAPFLGMELELTTAAGAKLSSSSGHDFVEHRSISLQASLSTGKTEDEIDMFAMSATEYAQLIKNATPNDGTEFPAMDRVPTVTPSFNVDPYVSNIPAGTLICGLSDQQRLCETHR